MSSRSTRLAWTSVAAISGALLLALAAHLTKQEHQLAGPYTMGEALLINSMLDEKGRLGPSHFTVAPERERETLCRLTKLQEAGAISYTSSRAQGWLAVEMSPGKKLAIPTRINPDRAIGMWVLFYERVPFFAPQDPPFISPGALQYLQEAGLIKATPSPIKGTPLYRISWRGALVKKLLQDGCH